jgi:hypothetical protein
MVLAGGTARTIQFRKAARLPLIENHFAPQASQDFDCARSNLRLQPINQTGDE